MSKRISIAILVFLSLIMSFDVMGGDNTISLKSNNDPILPFMLKIQKKDTVYWTNVINISLLLNQYAYSNWSAGGNNSIAGAAYFDQAFKYEKDKLKYTTTTSLGIGYMLLNGVDAPFRKTDDKMIFNAQGYYKINNYFAYSLLFDFKSQFANGYKYPDDSTLKSAFFSPAYMTISLGINFEPVKYFDCFVSPLSGKFTMVANDGLADQGAYGVTPAVYDTANNIIEHGKHFRSELGLNFVFKYSQELCKSIDVYSRLELHNSYLDERVANRWNFDIDFENKLIFHITKHCTTNLYCHILYDDDIRFPVYKDVDGVKVKTADIPRFQIYENLGIGFAFKF